MKMFLSAVVFALATQGAVAQSDPCGEAHKTQSSCDADKTTGGGCTWCKCAALPSACWTKANAAKLPAGVYACDSLAEVADSAPAPAPSHQPCLTPTQKKQLNTAITAIKSTLNTVDASLLIAAAAEKNKTIAGRIMEAEKVISAINTELVSNLTAIAEEACGNCTQIVKTVKDAVDALEETLTKIDPDWRTNPIYNAIVVAIAAILEIVKGFCPN